MLNIDPQEPLVSVIIPTYNRPAYLKEAIGSAVRQTYRHIEIIVSDNCSPENPQAIVESFQDSRIRFFRNSTNLGMFLNTINTFKQARGKYVASLHDDDMWEENFLEKLVPPLESNPDLTLAFCDHHIMDADGKIDCAATQKYSQFYKRQGLKEGIYYSFYELALVDQAVPLAMAAVIRRNSVEWDSIPSDVGGQWDLYLAYLCSCSGRGAYYYPARLTRYREHPLTDTKLSGKRSFQAKIRKAKAEIFCYESFMKDERLQKFKPYFKKKWRHANTTLGIGLVRASQAAEARSYFWHVLREKFDLRTIVALILSFTPPAIACRF